MSNSTNQKFINIDKLLAVGQECADRVKNDASVHRVDCDCHRCFFQRDFPNLKEWVSNMKLQYAEVVKERNILFQEVDQMIPLLAEAGYGTKIVAIEGSRTVASRAPDPATDELKKAFGAGKDFEPQD